MAAKHYIEISPPLFYFIILSVRLGLAALADLDGVMFCVCDQPWLRRDSVERLLADFSGHPGCICSLSWKGERG